MKKEDHELGWNSEKVYSIGTYTKFSSCDKFEWRGRGIEECIVRGMEFNYYESGRLCSMTRRITENSCVRLGRTPYEFYLLIDSNKIKNLSVCEFLSYFTKDEMKYLLKIGVV